MAKVHYGPVFFNVTEVTEIFGGPSRSLITRSELCAPRGHATNSNKDGHERADAAHAARAGSSVHLASTEQGPSQVAHRVDGPGSMVRGQRVGALPA